MRGLPYGIQPVFLPARSRQKTMAGLKDHFGENAELDDATAKRIGDYLAANAGDRGYFRGHALRGLFDACTPLRISDPPWFVRKHEKQGRISPSALQRAKAKSEERLRRLPSGGRQQRLLRGRLMAEPEPKSQPPDALMPETRQSDTPTILGNTARIGSNYQHAVASGIARKWIRKRAQMQNNMSTSASAARGPNPDRKVSNHQ